MSEATRRLTTTEHLGRLSRMAEETRSQLAQLQTKLRQSGISLPRGILERLRQLSGTLSMLQSDVEKGEVERRNLAALADLGQVINSSLDLEVVLDEVIDTIIRLTGADRAFLMLKSDSGQMETVVARNWTQRDLEQYEKEISGTIVDRVARTGESILTTNAQEDPRFSDKTSIVAYSLRSILCVPLKVKGKQTGVIYADNKVKAGLFNDSDRALLMAFANQAAVALENARLFESVRATLAEVTELKTLMEDVLASIASGVITADVKDSVTLVNQAAEAILAGREIEMVGRKLAELIPSYSEEIGALVRRAKEGGDRVIDFESRAKIEARGPVTLNYCVTPLRSANGDTEGVTLVVDDLTDKRRLEAQHRLFQRMVSPAVIDRLDPERLNLGGERGLITTLFADIRGYTHFSEASDPVELVNVLNTYLAAAADSVLEQGGTIDKFMGDAIMAWFNAPVAQEDHAERAVLAAVALQERVRALHGELPKGYHLMFGIGIHTGEALLGLVGSRQRLDYTAVGDSVNTAKRLQEAAKEGQILVSRDLADRLDPAIGLRRLEPIRAEGITQPIQVFEVAKGSQLSSGG